MSSRPAFLKQIRNNRGWSASLMRYLLTALFTTGLHYVLYLLLNLLMDARLAYTISYAVELTVNYLITSVFTFASHPNPRNSAGFIVVRVLAYLIEIGLLSLFLRIGMSEELAPLPVFLCVGLFNFLSLYKVVFRKKE